MELKTAWGSRTSIGSDGENNLVHVETVDTVESSTLPETSSPRQASNGNEQSKHEAEIEEMTDSRGVITVLFTLPNYCSPIAVLSLLHSRKIEDTDDDVKTDGNKINHQTNPSSSRNGEIENQPERIIIESESQTSNTDYDTMIYICATMWHETMEEMKNLIFSILRLDYDHALNSNSRLIKEYKAEDKELFQFEGHIFFDDAFECNKRKDGQKNVNKFVRQLKYAIGQAVSQFYNSDVKLEKPKCLNTLYGKRLEWKLPGENSLFIHLKDKDKIRHKKRWSQVMYLYYLLGFKLIQSNASDICDTKIDKQEIKVKNKKFSKKVENTFILALDGPVVWYQRFEYAVSHWLQKTTEHIFGCVLCSPGCFTLFRAKSLLSGNIMHEYTKMATTPREVVQYNLGEDRWFCTLLLKEGFRVEYFAAAHASTSVPKEFDALFTQRKRWIPSTIANLFDILQNSKQIRKNNQNVSYLYVIYQTILLMATILGPSTILLAMDAALQVVFGFQSWHVYVFVYGPPIFYIFLCLKLNSKLQLSIGVALSLAYSLLMLSVFIGTVVNIVKEGWYTPLAVFLYVLFGVFILAGLMHINEFLNLIHIFIYFIFLPLGYLFIPIYAICNMNDISWGTRENQNPEFVNTNTNDVNENQKTDVKSFVDANKQLLQEFNKFIFEKNQKPSSTYNILNIFRMSYYLLQFKLFESVESRLKQIKEGEANEITKESSKKQQKEEADSSKNINEDDWYKSDGVNEEYKKEETFWKKFQEKYVFPTKKSGLDKETLNKFRNKSATMFFFFNAVWIVIVSSMNEVKHELNIRFNIADGQPILIEPLGFSFLLIFALLLFTQVIGMTLHRYSTFLHVIAATDVRNDRFFDNIKIKKHVETLLSPKQDSEKINENQQTEDAQRNERRDDVVVQSSSTCPRNESSTNCQNINLTDIFHKRMKGKGQQKQNKKVNSERTEDAQENERHKDESVPSQSTGPRNESSTNPKNINQIV
ncbi:hypothetical protein KUTeg_019829 [Tegillarca granosa]|uniref:chitin synthase n=1 Tax=Tegillarca granosa TaxID=220873 RepID=A0ABQ9EJN3_TEGGR|nr:hypothetical protein KUTeg_019829 [Tegillarca granosa]